MDVNELIQIINSTGFPIVMCGALFWMIDKMRAESKEAQKENTQAITDVRVTLSELTSFIKTLIEVLEKDEEGGKDADAND